MLGTKTKSDGKVSAELMARVVDEARTRSSELAEATSAAGRYRPAGKLSAPAYLEACLQRAGHARAVAVDLAPAGLGVHVAKVLVPGLLLSELL